jgi:alpha-1,6-mannosyltransferase
MILPSLTALLLGCACALAWRDDSPLVPRDGGLARSGTAWGFALLLAGAFAVYVAALVRLRGTEAPLRPVAVLAVAVQLVPLATPLLLSTDAWSYWAYGRIGAHGGNPYVDEPSRFPESPALPFMGADWRDTTSVYGPAFTLAAEPLALAAADREDAAAWLFKALGAAAMAGAALLTARVARRRALAVAFVGWNPLLAVHAAGGGHNDAWVAAALAAALALAAARRPAGAGMAWAIAVLLKWVPLLFLALSAIAPGGTRGRRFATAFALTAVAVLALATWRFGLHWAHSIRPLAGNAARETSYAMPARLQDLGLSEGAALALAITAFVAGVAWLAREARRGRVLLGRAACLVLLTTPYLIVWYLAWAATLAAADEDRVARWAVLGFCVYLLPQTIPL